MKPMSERIKSAETELADLRDNLTAAVKELEDCAIDDEIGALEAKVDDLTLQVEKAADDLERLRRVESAMMKQSKPVEAPNVQPSNPLRVKDKDKASLLIKAAVATFESYCKAVPLERALADRYGDNEAVKAVTLMTTKATQNPAMTSVAGYAAELVRETYAGFMDLLQPESVIPRLPLRTYEFDGFGTINIPGRAPSPTTPNMEAHFRAEGAPIRVGGLTLESKTLTPKSLGIIGTFTEELFERSTPNIEAVIRDAMIQDTAEMLDKNFLGSTARSATHPGGIAAAATGDNTAASGGNTAADIMTDLKGRLAEVAKVNMGRALRWVMNPAQWISVQMAQNAMGTFQFPEAQNGQLAGYPVVVSTNVPAGTVFLIDCAEIAFAGGAPRFLGTQVASIHEEGDASAVAPIVGGANAAGATPAFPTRSLYQTYSRALRTVWELDWLPLRPGAVQTITGVAWT